MFYDEKLSITTEAYYLEPGLYSSITNIVKAMKSFIQKKETNTETLASQSKLAG